MRVLGTKIVIQQYLSDAQTKGGLALPDIMQSKLPMGLVVRCGPDAGVRPGMVVQYNGYAGSPVSVGGTDYVVIDTDDILIIMEDSDT